MPASTFSDKKYLIILSKDGGEDGHARFLPRDTQMLNDINHFRPTLQFMPAEVDSYTDDHLDADWCLHPSLTPLRDIYAAGDMAITHRVGPMFTNLNNHTLAEIRQATFRAPQYTGPIRYPLDIGAHDKQQFSTVSMITRDFVDQFGVPRTLRESGFIGRLMARFRAFTPSDDATPDLPALLPLVMGVGVNGTAFNLIGTFGTNRTLVFPVAGGRFSRQFRGASARQNAFLARLDAINALEKTEIRRSAFRDAAELLKDSMSMMTPIVENAAGAGVGAIVDGAFSPNSVMTGWQGIMRSMARVIASSETGIGLPRRLVLVGNVNGYDTHINQGRLTGTLPNLFADEAAAIASFRTAILSLPGGAAIWNSICITDTSEFSRTITENGSNGTDHAYARPYTAIGGAVTGGMYGTPPTAYGFTRYNTAGVLSGQPVGQPVGSHDINASLLGGGGLYPGISLEQYWDAILTWFGSDASDITAALPRRSEFGSSVAFI
jgi:uncharacterized protein (DUF1501 family)